MRGLIFFLAVTICLVSAKSIPEKLELPKLKTLVSNVSPTTKPPAVFIELSSHTGNADDKLAFEEQIGQVVEGSVENLIPFGAEEKSTVVKKELNNEEAYKNRENETGLSVVDWFNLMFSQDLSNFTDPLDKSSTIAIKQSDNVPKPDWLQNVLNQQRQLDENGRSIQTSEVTEDVPKKPIVLFAAKYEPSQDVHELSTHWLSSEGYLQKQDQYASAMKSKVSWSKLLAEPVDDSEQNTPTDNTAQWSSSEINSNKLTDSVQKQWLVPSNLVKNKEQSFDEMEM